MTGFGSAEAQWESWSCLVEIRSVNQRFLDVRFKMPSGFQTLEATFKKEVKKICSRGKIECSFKLDKTKTEDNLQLNFERTNAFHQNLAKFEEITGRNVVVSARDLVSSDIMSEDNDRKPPQECQNLMTECLQKALQSMAEMKVLEGDSMQKDIQSRLELCQQLVDKIELESKSEPKRYKVRLQERLEQLSNLSDFNPERLEQEIVLFSDRLDISEEIVRFRTHLDHMQEILAQKEAGKKAEFLMQEFNREVNTMASKSNHAGISQATVEIKSELEKIREQLANIE